MCKNSKSAQKSAQQRKSRVKVIDTSEMKGCVSMANIRENKKNGKVISFRFIVCLYQEPPLQHGGSSYLYDYGGDP